MIQSLGEILARILSGGQIDKMMLQGVYEQNLRGKIAIASALTTMELTAGSGSQLNNRAASAFERCAEVLS